MESESNPKPQETFGSYLRAFREKEALPVEMVARQTKIAVHCLNALEADDLGQLPPKAYVKSFIRSYAAVVGANADVALNLYLSDLERKAFARKQMQRRQAKLSAIRRILIAIGIITSILLLVRYTDLFLEPETTDGPGPPQVAEAVTDTTEPDVAQPAAQAPLEKMKLKVIAVEKTWIKIIVDGQNARSYDLKPEERLELEGATSFNLMIGDATGLKVFLNERPVKIYGSRGQVVSLKIP